MHGVGRVDPQRVRRLNDRSHAAGPVAYWMSRDQRVGDNWALIHAQDLAIERRSPLVVVFCLAPAFMGATLRQYAFMLRGLREVERDLAKLSIPFILLEGEPARRLPEWVCRARAGALVTDFDPLVIKRSWRSQVAERIDVPLCEVDAHNIVPCWVASAKQEYGAYTIRPKIQRSLPQFLRPFPELQGHPFPYRPDVASVEWGEVLHGLPCDRSVGEADWLVPGEYAGGDMMRRFIDAKLSDYPQARNDPTRDGQSQLSPYLHFGQLSAQRVALEARDRPGATEFLEELVIRRELSDNFCFYNPNYAAVAGFPEWARKTLDEHRSDAREFVYSLEELEQARTHDDLWNAAQAEMVRRGKMHGYMRMYWAKKILEWTESPEQAIEFSVYLNDRYELDGRDPNGYTGIAWSIGGVHDRAWGSRPVFGKIRYMSYSGCKSKFDVRAYIGRIGLLRVPRSRDTE